MRENLSFNPEEEQTKGRGGKSEISPEAESVIDSKREQILAGNLAVRFSSLSEYLSIIEEGETNRLLESIETAPDHERTRWNRGKLLGGLQGVVDQGRFRVGRKANQFLPGFISRMWGEAADHLTGGDFTPTPSMWRIGQEGRLIFSYYKKWKEEKNEKTRQQIKLEFTQLLVGKIPELLRQASRGRLFARSGEDQDVFNTDTIGRFKELQTKKPEEISDQDFRFLIRFVDSFPGEGAEIPYEVLQIWNNDVLLRGPIEEEWKDIECGSPSSKILGVIPLSPDKYFIRRVVTVCSDETKGGPKHTHLVIRMDGKEIYPNPDRETKFFDVD